VSQLDLFMLTPSEIEGQVQAVKEAVSARDHALAFSLEVTIWHDVLEAIAEGAWDTQDLAKAALSTLAVKFPRTIGGS
jgi:hypothetical protein